MQKAPGAACDACPLRDSVLVHPRGVAGSITLLLIGEGPGRDECRLGRVFVGKTGRYLQRVLDAYGVRKIWLTNAVLCGYENFDPSEVDAVKEAAAQCCRARLIAEIKARQPKAVLTMGALATNIVLGEGAGITRRRGKSQYLQELQVRVVPTVHPAYVLRKPSAYPDFAVDLQKAMNYAMGTIDTRPRKAPPAKVTVDVDEAFRAANASRYTILDLETSGFKPHRHGILCVVLGTEQGVFVLPRMVVYSDAFKRQLANCKTKWVGHGSKFDRSFLKHHLGVTINFTFDSQLGHYILDERPGHDLKELCMRYFEVPDWEANIREHLDHPKTDSYALLPKKVLYKYAAYDGYYTRLLTDHLVEQLRKYPKLAKLVRTLLVPAANALSDVELYGARVDREAVARVDRWLTSETFKLEKELESLGGMRINPRSHKQVAVLLFDELGLPQIRGRHADKHVLAALKDKHPVVPVLRRCRRATKMHGTYVQGLIKRLSPDGRVRSNFLIFGTVTGRLSSRDPNLQNIPSDPDDPLSMMIRNFYIASPGMSLLYLDFRQMELTCLALQSEDRYLVTAYREDRDLHDETAKEIFGPNFTPRERWFAKSVNFGLPYGRRARGLARDTNLPGMSMKQAEVYIKRHFQRMPQALSWTEGIRQLVHTQGFVESVTGRRRRFPMRDKSNFAAIAHMEREAINFTCQSLASDITLTSLINIHRELAGRAHIILTVHDSILLECLETDVQEVAREASRIMVKTARGIAGDLVPFRVDAEVGQSWGAMHPLEMPA